MLCKCSDKYIDIYFILKITFCSDRILTFRIRSICSPAKVGLVVTELLITSPVVSWNEWETPPPPPAPRLNCHSLLNHGWVKTSLCMWTAFVYVYIWWRIGFFDTDENEYYFPFILFVSYVIFVIYVCPGVG